MSVKRATGRITQAEIKQIKRSVTKHNRLWVEIFRENMALLVSMEGSAKDLVERGWEIADLMTQAIEDKERGI